MKRQAEITRKTKETYIRLKLDLEGEGNSNIKTGLGFLNHMLELLTQFSGLDLYVRAKGDLEVDEHHLIEDAGICLGQALKKSLGAKKGINRFGFASLPMDETLIQVSLDISGRPYLAFNIPKIRGKKNRFDTENTKEFLKGLINHSGITLHINHLSGDNLHHVNEAIFKGLALALKQAISRSGERLPSTKGKID